MFGTIVERESRKSVQEACHEGDDEQVLPLPFWMDLRVMTMYSYWSLTTLSKIGVYEYIVLIEYGFW